MTETNVKRSLQIAFAVGDYAAGGATGILTAVAVRAVVGPETDMVIAMLLGTVVGMAVHLPLGLLLSPLLGTFHVMVPGSLIGMYGGMLFAMRDSMQPHYGSAAGSITVGATFGLAVTLGLRLYDRALRRNSDPGEE